MSGEETNGSGASVNSSSSTSSSSSMSLGTALTVAAAVANFARRKGKFQEKWSRMELKELLKGDQSFKTLNDADLTTLAGLFEEIPISSTEPTCIMRQGETGGTFCIATRGVCEVWVEKDGVNKCEFKGGPGIGYGAHAILYNKPRSATVLAQPGSIMWSLSKEEYMKWQRIVIPNANPEGETLVTRRVSMYQERPQHLGGGGGPPPYQPPAAATSSSSSSGGGGTGGASRTQSANLMLETWKENPNEHEEEIKKQRELQLLQEQLEKEKQSDALPRETLVEKLKEEHERVEELTQQLDEAERKLRRLEAKSTSSIEISSIVESESRECQTEFGLDDLDEMEESLHEMRKDLVRSERRRASVEEKLVSMEDAKSHWEQELETAKGLLKESQQKQDEQLKMLREKSSDEASESTKLQTQVAELEGKLHQMEAMNEELRERCARINERYQESLERSNRLTDHQKQVEEESGRKLVEIQSRLDQLQQEKREWSQEKLNYETALQKSSKNDKICNKIERIVEDRILGGSKAVRWYKSKRNEVGGDSSGDGNPSSSFVVGLLMRATGGDGNNNNSNNSNNSSSMTEKKPINSNPPEEEPLAKLLTIVERLVVEQEEEMRRMKEEQEAQQTRLTKKMEQQVQETFSEFEFLESTISNLQSELKQKIEEEKSACGNCAILQQKVDELQKSKANEQRYSQELLNKALQEREDQVRQAEQKYWQQHLQEVTDSFEKKLSHERDLSAKRLQDALEEERRRRKVIQLEGTKEKAFHSTVNGAFHSNEAVVPASALEEAQRLARQREANLLEQFKVTSENAELIAAREIGRLEVEIADMQNRLSLAMQEAHQWEAEAARRGAKLDEEELAYRTSLRAMSEQLSITEAAVVLTSAEARALAMRWILREKANGLGANNHRHNYSSSASPPTRNALPFSSTTSPPSYPSPSSNFFHSPATLPPPPPPPAPSSRSTTEIATQTLRENVATASPPSSALERISALLFEVNRDAESNREANKNNNNNNNVTRITTITTTTSPFSDSISSPLPPPPPLEPPPIQYPLPSPASTTMAMHHHHHHSYSYSSPSSHHHHLLHDETSHPKGFLMSGSNPKQSQLMADLAARGWNANSRSSRLTARDVEASLHEEIEQRRMEMYSKSSPVAPSAIRSSNSSNDLELLHSSSASGKRLAQLTFLSESLAKNNPHRSQLTASFGHVGLSSFLPEEERIRIENSRRF